MQAMQTLIEKSKKKIENLKRQNPGYSDFRMIIEKEDITNRAPNKN